MLLGAGSVGFVAAFGGPTPPATVPMLLAAAALALGLVPMQGGLLIGLPPGDVPLAEAIAAGLAVPVARYGLLCFCSLPRFFCGAGRCRPPWRRSPPWRRWASRASRRRPSRAGSPPGARASRRPRRLLGQRAPASACELPAPAPRRARRCSPRARGRRADGDPDPLPVGLLTPYGAAFALKLAGVAALLLIALWNRSRSTPALAAGLPHAAPRRSIGIESCSSCWRASAPCRS
jgi:hypothetical protein